MARPIPKSLLIHSGVYKSQPTTDAWDKITWGKTEDLTNVRFEPSAKLIKTKDNREVQLAAVMFFDCRNSDPKTAAFSVGNAIEQTGGDEYRIEYIEQCNDQKGVHHLEIGLS